MEVSDRLPGLPMNHLANADGRKATASGGEKAAVNTSVENLLAEFGVMRSAIIRRIGGREPQGANVDAKYAYVADICVTRFNERIDEIERWRGSELVGFSAARLRAEAAEAELNQVIVELSREDFLAGNFDFKSLFSLLFDRFYSEDFVLWLGAQETTGRTAAFQRMADVLEPINTLLEMGLASLVSFRAMASAQDSEGISSLIGKPFSEERIRQACPFVGARFGHGRVAQSSRNASRDCHRRSHEPLVDAHVDAQAGGTADLRGTDFTV